MTFKQLLEGQTVIRNDIAEMKAQLLNVEGQISSLQQMVSHIEKRLSELPSSPEDGVQNTLKSIEHVITFQSKKLTDLEDRNRRSNIIIHGVSECPEETEALLKEKVLTTIMRDKMNVQCESIGRIHRLGRLGSKRPVIVYLQNFNEKKLILDSCRKLRGSGISIQNDYSQATLKKRKFLWESAKAEKLQGKKVHLLHDKLKVDKELYFWDETKNMRVKITNQRSQQSDI